MLEVVHQKAYATRRFKRCMPLLQLLPGGPELFVVALMILMPLAFIYIVYKLVQGFQAYQEGKKQT